MIGAQAVPAGSRAGVLARLLAPERRLWLGAIFGSVLAAYALFALHSYRSVERELTDAALSRRLAISRLAAVSLAGRFDGLINIGVSLATRVRFSELVVSGNWTDAVAILRSVPRDFPFIERVFLADASGTLMADAPELAGVRGRNFADREWYQGVTRDWKPYISPVYRREALPQRYVFAVAVPIQDRDRRRAGILVLQVHLEEFFDWIADVDIGPGGFLYVIDGKGQAAYQPQPRAQDRIADLSHNPVVIRALAGKEGVEVTFDPDQGEEHVAAYVPSRHGWAVVAQQPASAAFAARDNQLRRIVIGYMLLLAFCALAIYLATRLLVQRVRMEEAQEAKTELERRVADRTAQLEAANKELESFSYSVSHDLRAPLRAIDGYALMIEEDCSARLDDEGRRLLGVVRESAAQMARLIDDLLRFSQVGRRPLAVAPLDMSALAREVVAELGGAYPKTRVDLEVLPSAVGDRALLRQVWTNLIGNALKYSARRESPRVEIGGRLDGTECRYWVRDNGAGFDMRYCEKLFGVFQRLHREEEFEGSGVGLAIVQRVVARHSGRVWAEGKPDAGACFHFALPTEG